ncbi:hypothetical protein ALC60_01575 [Trachymyrmex zeteki]|uniref:BED-type domain-containing protein n=1 Tax=Mycetomoellerius zeteki TaxID=64791 RepID=A0A151XG87_9HYME|nr:hypothetical protein ALC60_01575 [Trachymyrmex zeteki]
MAAREGSDSWVWEHLLKLYNFTTQCNIDSCYQTYEINNINKNTIIKTIKGHLYHKHEIWNEEDRLKWENDNDLIWRYFDKVGLYKEKCKFCNNSFFVSYTPKLKDHLRDSHRQEIRAMIRKEIADNLLSQYFKIDEEKFSARCKRCNINIHIFYGIDELIYHNHFQRDQCLWSHKRPEDNNGNRMTQQSIADGNTGTSSHQDNINMQAPRNQDQRSIFYSNTEIKDLKPQYQNHVHEYSRFRGETVGNNVHGMMHQFVAAENVGTSSHNDGTNWQALGYQVDQQRYVERLSSYQCHVTNDYSRFQEGIDVDNVHGMMHQFVAAENVDTSSHNDSTNWQALGYQVDQQRTMQQFVTEENVGTSSHNDGTNWQALGYQVDQQRLQKETDVNNMHGMMHQFMAAENVSTSSHNDGTNWHALGYQVDQQRFQEGTNVNNVHRMMHQFVAAENVATSSHNYGTIWQTPGNQENHENEISLIDVLTSF